MNPVPDNPTKPALVRWVMITLGLACVVVAGVGVVLPGLPTTVFLIIASYFFTRSCPPLDRWLRTSRVFRPYATYLDRSQPMPRHAVVWTLVIIWMAIGFSVLRLWDGYGGGLLSIGALAIGAVASSSVVWFGRVLPMRADRGAGARVEAPRSG